MTGLNAVNNIFDAAKAQGRAAFMPYFPIGYPTYDASLDAIQAMAETGVDGFEIGIPFSDPLADGPTIQAATQVALENGTTVRDCLRAVKELRERGVTQPMLLMGYLNPMIAYGVEQFVRDAKAAGADGFIVPDLPPDEAGLVAQVCDREGMALVFFLAPTSNNQRIDLVSQQARGFIYCVSFTGVTGTQAVPTDVREFINRVRARTDQRLVMGFGISTPDQARMMNEFMDGFIVGTAMVKAGQNGTEAVRSLSASLRSALNKQEN